MPAVVGVPERCPAGVSVSPAGSEPFVTVNVRGALPFAAPSVASYATLIAPSGRNAGVIASTGQDTVIEYARLPAQPPVSEALTVNENAPPWLGAPVSAPELESVRPGGRAPAVRVNV